MLMTITATGPDAEKLGWLLHKHPGKLQVFDPAPGMKATVFYPEAGLDLVSFALMLSVDEIAWAAAEAEAGRDSAWVSDRPWNSGSALSRAIRKVLATALQGRCDKMPDAVGLPLPLAISITPLACRSLVLTPSSVFGPWGWEVSEGPLEEQQAGGHNSSMFRHFVIRATKPLHQALKELVVGLAAIDGRRDSYLHEDEAKALMSLSGPWLNEHPRETALVRRFLGGFPDVVRAYRLLLAQEAGAEPTRFERQLREEGTSPELAGKLQGLTRDDAYQILMGGEMRLQEDRIYAAIARLSAAGASHVADLGCGEGDLLLELARHDHFKSAIGVEAEPRIIEQARRRIDKLPTDWKEKLSVIQGSVWNPDRRLRGCDAAALLEVIEHIEPSRLDFLGKTLFTQGFRTVVMTTPNKEFNEVFGMNPGQLRHQDHRFEWSRAEFLCWARSIGNRYGYEVEPFGVGPAVEGHGTPTQGMVFRRH